MPSLFERLRSPAALVFLGAFVFQMLLFSRHAASHHLVPGSDDMKFYLDWGTRIAGGRWTDHKAFYGLPGYAYWLGALLILTARDAVAASLITGAVQTVLFAGVACLIFVLSRDAVCMASSDERSGGERPATLVGCLAAAAWVFFVPAQAYSVILMPTVGAVLAYWYGVRFLSFASGKTSLWAWMRLGLLIGFTALFIATVFFLLPLACFTILRAISKSTAPGRVFRGAAASLILFAGVLAGTSPAWLHNFNVAKDPVVLSAHSGINMWIGNNPVANGYPKIPQGLRSGQEGLLRDSLLIPERIAGRPLPRSEVSQFWVSKARKWIKENPADWLHLLVTKLENFWNAFQYDDINILRLLKLDGVTFGFSSFGIISALGLAGIPTAAWRLPYSRWVIAGVLLHMLALIPVFVTERYRLAAVPGLLTCASLGLWLLWRSVIHRQWFNTVAQLFLLGAGAAFASIPKGDSGAWALSYYNTGVRSLAIAERAHSSNDLELMRNEFARSQSELEVAFAYAPASTEINLALGNLWLAKDDSQRAAFFYRRVLSIEPGHPSASNNLGVLALKKHRWTEALQLLKHVRDLDPTSPKSHYLVAKALQGLGDIHGALTAIEAALLLKPDQTEFRQLRDDLIADDSK